MEFISLDNHQQFWNQWSKSYQSFSETIEPYRDAQQRLAEAAVAALSDQPAQDRLTILDIGGGAGNFIRPLLETLQAQRGHLRGVGYTLTDGAKEMLKLAQGRRAALQKRFPEVAFTLLRANTLTHELQTQLGKRQGDLVVSSWNIEYYPLELRQEIVRRLTQLANAQGVVAFSSSVHLPESLSVRDVLMPLGQAQVFQSLLTSGPTEMKKVITSLKQIAAFGMAVNSLQFPAKPTLNELGELAQQAGLEQVHASYHLFGTSGMVVARKGSVPLPNLPKLPIAQQLFGKAGYEGYSETSSFWSYFTHLVRNPPQI